MKNTKVGGVALKQHGNKGKKFTEDHKRKIGNANKISKIKQGYRAINAYKNDTKKEWTLKENE